ncbi:hypothetical protein RV03_GL003141 [Enterococcus gallinarum]|nr:hypothetical protein RV03_GL003141 [Enterococcus gallinarum]
MREEFYQGKIRFYIIDFNRKQADDLVTLDFKIKKGEHYD